MNNILQNKNRWILDGNNIMNMILYEILLDKNKELYLRKW